MRVACTQLSSINVGGVSFGEVCVSVPALFGVDAPICGWEAISYCYEMTDMKVHSLAMLHP